MKGSINAVLAVAVSVAAVSAHAETSILTALKAQGVELQMLSDSELGDIKGAARMVGQPLPSVTVGLKNFHVTWKKFGALDDHRSYIWSGFSYDPNAKPSIVENGIRYSAAGDAWLADRTSNPGSWNAANAVQIDSHLQALDRETGQPMNFGWRSSTWSRPISTFTW